MSRDDSVGDPPADERRRGPLALYTGRGLPPNVKALSATSFLQDVASEMVYPLLPGFLVALGGGAALLGVMESAAEGVLALVKGWAGRASDRGGRRKPWVAHGYGWSAATRPLLALATTAWQVVALRVADRFAKGLRTAPRDALIAESTPEASRGFAFSFHRGLDHLGAAVGPLLAAAILELAPGGLRWVFALATLPALGGVLVVLWRVVERPPRDAATPEAEPSRAVRRRLLVAPPRRLVLPLVAFFLFALGNASDAFLLLAAAGVGLTPVGLTLLWSGFHVAKWLASAPGGRLADRLGPRTPILAGWAIYAAVYLGFAQVARPQALILLFLPYAAFYGLTEGAERALVSRFAAEGGGTGTVLGLFHLVTGLGAFVASLLFGVLWQLVSPAAAFTLGAVLAAAAAALLAFGPPTGRSVPS